MSRRWLAVILGVQVAFFVLWAIQEEGRKGEQSFVLETEGVDPRDLFAGKYLTLAYPMARLNLHNRLEDQPQGSSFAVRLEPAGDTVVAGKAYPLRRAAERVALLDKSPGSYPAKDGWALGERDGSRIRFGIERYYFSETREREMNDLRPGSYFVRVTLGRDGRLRIQEIVH